MGWLALFCFRVLGFWGGQQSGLAEQVRIGHLLVSQRK